MSSILKALRKVEEEKAARQGGSFDIARDILRPSSRPRRRSRSLLPAGIFLGVFLVGGSAFLLSSRFADKATVETTVENIAASAPDLSLATDSRAALPPPEIPFEQSVSARQTVPLADEPVIVEEILPREIPTFPEQVRKPSVITPKLTGKGAEQPQVVRPDPSAIAAATPPGLSEPAIHVAAPLRPLVVSGIAFQEDPQTRLAIINDLPVMVGTVIEGAVIEEILTDRVRFSTADRKFEVLLQE